MVKRYFATVGACGPDTHRIDYVEDERGNFVKAYDYERLYAEVEALRAELADLRAGSPASEPHSWQPIASAPEQRKIIVHYLNPLGNSRVVMACWYGEKSLEMEDDNGSGDYDEASGCTYAPPGWYEEHDSDEPILPLGGKPTHWLPVPAPPRAADQPATARDAAYDAVTKEAARTGQSATWEDLREACADQPAAVQEPK